MSHCRRETALSSPADFFSRCHAQGHAVRSLDARISVGALDHFVCACAFGANLRVVWATFCQGSWATVRSSPTRPLGAHGLDVVACSAFRRPSRTP